MTLFSADAWLSDTMQRGAYRWNGTAADRAALTDEMQRLAAGSDAFFYARTPASDTDGSRQLERAGFAVVDVSIAFEWIAEPRWPETAARVELVRPDQHAAMADIAARSFTKSRFHLDSRVGAEMAGLIKRRWIENYCLGRRGSGLYAAEIDGAPAGFLAVIAARDGNRTSAVIDLIAVDPACQGKGVGGALVRRFVDDWRSQVSALRVGTQAANISSMRFYETVGFRAAESSLVLHAHLRGGEVML